VTFTIAGLIRAQAGARPGKTAIAFAGRDVSYADLDRRSSQAAHALRATGVGPGDRIALIDRNGPEFFDLLFGAAKVGAVFVAVNWRLSPPEMAFIINDSTTSVLVLGPEAAEQLDAMGELPRVRTTVVIGNDYEDWLATAASTDPGVTTAGNDVVTQMYTSGTTGLPKGIAVRHSNLAMVPNLEPAWTGNGWIHGAPMFTFAGIAFIYNPMKMGLVGFYQPRFDAGRWLEYVEQERPTWCMLVPAFAELIVAHPDFGRRDLSSLQQVSIGSAPLAPQTQLALIERLPDATVGNSYGMTEAGPAYIVMPKEEIKNRIGSVGKPVGPMEIKIVDDDGEETAPRVVGELWLRMAGKQREYYKNDEATAATWTDDGWLRSGDLAYLDEDSYLYICGRKKDMIIRGGNNIYATDVEAVLLEHPDVQEAAVTGIPHPVLGEDVAAWVVRHPGSDLDTERLTSFVAERLADYKRPRQLVFVDELPRNATGKVLKHELKVPTASS